MHFYGIDNFEVYFTLFLFFVPILWMDILLISTWTQAWSNLGPVIEYSVIWFMVRNCWIFMKRHENMDRHKGNSVSFWSPLYSRKLHFVNNLGLIWISNFRLVLVCGKFNKIAFSKILFTVNTLTICKNISRLFMVATLGILLTCNLINYRCVNLETVIVVFDQNPQNQFRFDFRTKSWTRVFFLFLTLLGPSSFHEPSLKSKHGLLLYMKLNEREDRINYFNHLVKCFGHAKLRLVKHYRLPGKSS